MTWIDWLILGILIYNVGGGLMNGLIRSLFNIAALVGAYLFTPVVKPILTQVVIGIFQLPDNLAIPIGIGLSWTFIYLAISIAGNIVAGITGRTPLKIVDRLGGAGFGLAISALLIVMPLALVESIPMVRDLPPVKDTLKGSMLVPMVQPATNFFKASLGPALVNFWVQEDKARIAPPKASATPPVKQVPVKASAKPTAQPR